MGLLRCNFFLRAHFYTLSKTLITCIYIETCSSDFFKVKTLLNDAFKVGIRANSYIVRCLYIGKRWVYDIGKALTFHNLHLNCFHGDFRESPGIEVKIIIQKTVDKFSCLNFEFVALINSF